MNNGVCRTGPLVSILKVPPEGFMNLNWTCKTTYLTFQKVKGRSVHISHLTYDELRSDLVESEEMWKPLRV